MSQLHCTTKRKPGQHITYEERKMLEYLYDQNLQRSKKKKKAQKELAEDLGWSQATLSRELARGKTMQRNSQLEEYECYSAKVAQCSVEANWENKGPDLKRGNDHILANVIEAMLLGEKVPGLQRLRYSPDAIVMELDEKGLRGSLLRICAPYLNYIW